VALLVNPLRTAIRKALDARAELGIPSNEPLNVYDAAVDLNCEVLFVDIPSAEGMYLRDEPPTIVVSSRRPQVRQVYTCAHELGHHRLGHGEVIDELFEMRTRSTTDSAREREADAFAGSLLMTPTAVDRAFSDRGIVPELADPRTIMVIASYFQVGYATLVRHLQVGIKRLSWARAEELLRISPRQIRSGVFGFHSAEPLIIVDEKWVSRVALDCTVGDWIHAPARSSGTGAVYAHEESTIRVIFNARAPGTGALTLPDGKVITVRIARKNYVGRLKFRWEPEIEYA
jgi:hypothetical protein